MTSIPSPRSKKRARIEIIPLIDIIFFLLATFVMVSLSMVKNLGVPVNLPVATTATPQSREEAAVITINAAGERFFNQQPATEAELETALQQLRATEADPKVFIHGDQKTEFGAAMAVLDQVRRVGITKVAIETQPAPASSTR